MAKGKRRKRKARRQWAAALKWGPSAKPSHRSPKGRTGKAHGKSRSRPPKKVLREMERLLFGPDLTKRTGGGYANWNGRWTESAT